MATETPKQRGVRLASALEDLVAQEAACIEAGDLNGVADIQARTAEVVHELAACAEALDSRTREAIATVLRRREASLANLAGHIARTRRELDDLQATQRRAAKVAPVYGGKPAIRGSLSFSG